MATPSAGTYRIPYQSGTNVEVTRDHLSHEPPTRIDMHGVDGDEPYRIVAAADGVIRFLVDRFSEQRPDRTPCNNNYVWIEHDNGEWTKYSHMRHRSTSRDAGLAVGDRVRAGTFLGFEGAVGCAHGEHLHFEVGVPIDPDDPIDDDGFLRGGSARNRIPRICGISGQTFVDGETYRAASCTPVVIVPTVVSFGSVRPGTSSRRTVTVTNLSGRDMTLSLAASPAGSVFQWSGFSRRLHQGDATSIQVTFTPRSSAIERATLRLTSNAAGSPHTVGLVGKGVGGFPTPSEVSPAGGIRQEP
jgi:hypothetical protein